MDGTRHQRAISPLAEPSGSYNAAMPIIVFVRGINVGGHRRFRPSILAQQLEEYGAFNIGAAGTFVFTKRIGQSRLRAEILRRLPFEAEVMLCSSQALITATENCPFDYRVPSPDIVRFVSVLQKPPRLSPVLPMRIPNEGRWLVELLDVRQQFVFGVYRREMKAISCLGSLDKLFGVTATTRSWTTINSVLNMLEKL